MNKKDISKVEILNSIVQFSYQHEKNAEKVSSFALANCLLEIKNIEGELDELFSQLEENEKITIENLISATESLPILSDQSFNKVSDYIETYIRKNWLTSMFKLLKWLVPTLLFIAALAYLALIIFFPKIWLATYYPNRNLTGKPFGVYMERNINHAWEYAAPQKGLKPDDYSVRFESKMTVSEDGEYTIKTKSDDGIRVFINNDKIIDAWKFQDGGENTETITLKKGTHNVKVEYFEAYGRALLEFEVRGPKGAKIMYKLP